MVVSDDDDADDDDIDCFVFGGQDVKLGFVGGGAGGGGFVSAVLLLLRSDTWRVNAGRAGRLPQMMPQVISAMLLVFRIFVWVSVLWYL